MKRLMIRIVATRRPPLKIRIHPNSKVSDILSQLNLQDYVLCQASNPQREFANEAVLYDLVANDEKLIARISTAEADAFMERIAFGEGEI